MEDNINQIGMFYEEINKLKLSCWLEVEVEDSYPRILRLKENASKTRNINILQRYSLWIKGETCVTMTMEGESENSTLMIFTNNGKQVEDLTSELLAMSGNKIRFNRSDLSSGS